MFSGKRIVGVSWFACLSIDMQFVLYLSVRENFFVWSLVKSSKTHLETSHAARSIHVMMCCHRRTAPHQSMPAYRNISLSQQVEWSCCAKQMPPRCTRLQGFQLSVGAQLLFCFGTLRSCCHGLIRDPVVAPQQNRSTVAEIHKISR